VDKNLFDYEAVYDTAFTLDKANRLVYHQTAMTHAMLFTGVDVVNNRPRRWRVREQLGRGKMRTQRVLRNERLVV